VRAGRFGAAAPPDEDVTYDDWEGIGAVTSLPNDAWHRLVDKIVLAAGESGEVLTAIVCPPTISGAGRGPGNRKSVQWNKMAKCVLQRGKGFHVGEGNNWWTWVHVQDLSDLFVTLIDAALDKIAGGSGGKATWGKEGYYFAETGPFCWGSIAKMFAKEGKSKGLLKTDEVDSVGKDQADLMIANGAAYWGLNSKCKAIRARKLLGWEPKKTDLNAVVSEIVEVEALALGMIKTNAQVAGGV
jgi:nucleoside-diphosphate-sugar epimerase